MEATPGLVRPGARALGSHPVKVRGRLSRADLAYGLGMLSPQLLAAFARRGATVSAVVEASARRFGDGHGGGRRTG